ncbi:MAG: DUF2189 domain-containing protein [Hyphomicrobiaceae bacterium]
MARPDIIAPMEQTDTLPVVRSVGLDDLRDAIIKGVDDFRAMPTHVVFLCLIYPIVGLLIGRFAFGYNVIPLLYPVAAGFALVGPIAAIGLYELSRRRELGLDTSWIHAVDVFRSPSLPAIGLMGGLLLLIFILWVSVAHSLYVSTFGYAEPSSLYAFAEQVFTTPEGHLLIVAGNAIGFVFALAVLMVSVVTFPLLLDRNVGAAAAMLTSIRAVVKNPVTMAAWGLFVACALAIGSLPLFFGLAIVMPILGHATWHLYRKVVEPDPNPRPEYHPKPRAIHHGAQFPSSLFFASRREDDQDGKD